jgi:hypothetical protein
LHSAADSAESAAVWRLLGRRAGDDETYGSIVFAIDGDRIGGITGLAR